MEAQFRGQRSWRHVMRSAKCGKEVIECILVGYIDVREPHAYFVFVTFENVVVPAACGVNDGAVDRTRISCRLRPACGGYEGDGESGDEALGRKYVGANRMPEWRPASMDTLFLSITDGMRTGLQRDAVRSQVIGVLEAQVKETGNEEGGTVAAKASKKISQQKLIVGLDLRERSSCYCVLDEGGCVLLEQRLSPTPKALRQVFGAMPYSRIALEMGMHSPLGELLAQ